MAIANPRAICALLSAIASLLVENRARADATPPEVPRVVVQAGHTVGVMSIAFSPDGALLATADAAGRVVLWDLRTGLELRQLVGHTASVQTVAFSPASDGGARLLTNSSDGSVRIWDWRRGTVLRSLPGGEWIGAGSAAWSPDGKSVLAPRDGVLHRHDAATGIDLGTVGDGAGFGPRWSARGDRLLTVVGKDLRVADGAGKELVRLSGCERVGSHALAPDGARVAASCPGGEVLVWSARGGPPARRWHLQRAEGVAFLDRRTLLVAGGAEVLALDVETGAQRRFAERYVETLLPSPRGDVVAAVAASEIVILDGKTGLVTRQLAGRSNAVSSVAFAGDGTLMAQSGEVKRWDLDTLSFHRRFEGAVGMAVSPTGHRLAVGRFSNTPEVDIYDSSTAERLATVLGGAFGKSLSFARDGTLASVGLVGQQWVMQVWEPTHHASVWRLPSTRPLLGAALSADGERLALVSTEPGAPGQGDGGDLESMTIYDVRTHQPRAHWQGRSLLLLTPYESRPVVFSPDGERVAVASWQAAATRDPGDGVALVDARTGHELRRLRYGFGHAFSPDGHTLAIAHGSEVSLVDAASGELRATLVSPGADLGAPAFSLDGTLVAAGTTDGLVALWDATEEGKGKLRVSLIGGDWQPSAGLDAVVAGARFGAGHEDYLALTPEGYYSGSRDAFHLVAFAVGDRALPFESFDLRFNRPAEVLRSLGRASEATLERYRGAWRRRLERMGLDERALAGELALPRVTLLVEPPAVSHSPTVMLHVRASAAPAAVPVSGDATSSRAAPVATLARVIVSVNGVPLPQPLDGSAARILGKRVVELALPVELTPGVNDVRVVVTDARGSESLPEVRQLTFDGAAPPPRLFVVAIGVSAYRDERFHLDYAAKDARDLADFLEHLQYSFPERKLLRLLDGDATLERIAAARTFLADARAGDEAIVYLAGHGLLDGQGDFYFGTVDIDFAHPERRGLAYARIEELLDGTRARRKLLLIDACHAGELDADERRAVRDQSTLAATGADTIVAARSFRGVVAKAAAQGPSSAAHGPQEGARGDRLLAEIFADLRRGSGAVVIAGAGGAEYAIESAQWHNGVFTWSLLDAMRRGVRTVKALRESVAARVDELTRGRQRPSMRRDNVEFDFAVF